MRNFLKMLLVVGLLVSLAANLFMYQRFRNRRVVMSVNGHNVTQQDIYDYLVQNGGPEVKKTIVQRLLIQSEAEKKKLLPDEKEVQEQFEEARERDWKVARELNNFPWKEATYKTLIRQQMETVRLLTDGLPVTEDQIKEEYAANPQLADTPAKAHVELALLKNLGKEEAIKQLMEKTPKIDPTLIQTNYPGDVFFIGDNNRFTFYQSVGTEQNKIIFNMKPDQVAVLPPEMFAQMGIQKIIVRMLDIVPGKKADLNDPKTHEKVRLAVAMKRAKPLQEYLVSLWTNADFKSENAGDKTEIERQLAPDRKTQ